MQSTTLALLVKDGPLSILHAAHDLEPILSEIFMVVELIISIFTKDSSSSSFFY